jgi:hypothetical protein
VDPTEDAYRPDRRLDCPSLVLVVEAVDRLRDGDPPTGYRQEED